MKDSKPEPVKVEDEAARAGWLYYIAGMTQDEIARELGLSRQRAQRLVSRALAEGLIQVRLDHPIAACLALEAALVKSFGLTRCRVAPSLPVGMDQTASIAPLAAREIEQALRGTEALVVGLGTGRTMRAAVEEMSPMVCDHHRMVSLTGTIGPDGAGTFYDVIIRLAEKVRAPHYPMPVPVICDSAAEREAFHRLGPVTRVAELARSADVTFLGLGQLGDDAPLLADGQVDQAELQALRDAGGVGELVGWVYDAEGRYLGAPFNDRVGGVRVDPGKSRVTCFAAGPAKRTALAAGLRGGLFTGLVTDEATARYLLERTAKK